MYFNLDCTDFFYSHEISAGSAGETIDRYIDNIVSAGVDVLLCNTNARRTNYRSAIWEAFWDGYDPEGPDKQPFAASIPPGEVAQYMKLVKNMLAVHEEGVDFPAQVIRRCRKNGVSPWISLRMNDCHSNETPNHPFHGTFWRDNPQFTREGCSGYFANCLDYALPQVRDYYMALIEETLERYDINGLELDFMREPFIFSAGKEAEGKPVLTGWIREVRKKVRAAAERRGHPIRLGIRVPSSPETALAMGLDFMTWAKDGLIELLTVTPRWETLQFDLPIGLWREMLGETDIVLLGGLEVLYRPMPGGEPSYVTPELARGAVALVYSQGADALYLFNYFPSHFPDLDYQEVVSPLASLDMLLKLPRRVGITYRDIPGPEERYKSPLPATGQELVFLIKLGPIPKENWYCEILLKIVLEPGNTKSAPSVFVNGFRCCFLKADSADNDLRILRFQAPVETLREVDVQEMKIVSDSGKSMTVQQLEVLLQPGQ